MCYTIVHYGEKHPCFYYKNHETVYTIPQLDESEEMDTKRVETKEEHTGDSNDNYEDIWAAAQQNGNGESYKTNALYTENTEQISLMPASMRRNDCSWFAVTPNNTPYDISHDASHFDSICSVRERDVNSKENASFQALSESFEPHAISESGFRRTHKTKFSIPPDIFMSKINVDQRFPHCVMQNLVKNGKPCQMRAIGVLLLMKKSVFLNLKKTSP
ncbi:hypothetical protein AVEN_152761-1 [Araneus ventricosus]|uniref:Uncharacterized protein n=1 Tax=Araneus ventricosus TaxID=182803 RepID=A0A4Y2KXS6_ARAVE|nr:hypothetical protein AVEN_152761-1 [Araneus ventricosus]